MKKIVILDGYTENPGDLSWDGFRQLGDVICYDRTSHEDDEIIRRIGDAQIILVNKVPIHGGIMDACPSLRYIGVLATGYNVIDVAAARERGITVTNVPTYGTQAVAQYTMGLILEACLHIGRYDRLVHKGAWAEAPDFCFYNEPLSQISGKTLGIIGFGRIGRETARLAQAFGMNVLACNSREEHRQEEGGIRLTDMDEIFRKADILSLHCPLTPATTGLICKETIAKMKDGVILINTSRGPVIEEKDLAEALASGKVAYACLDVSSTEPMPLDSPLMNAPHCIITPHIAWASKEARSRLMDIALDNLRGFLAGTPRNVV